MDGILLSGRAVIDPHCPHRVPLEWSGVLLIVMGTCLVYIGLLNLFPARYYRRAYRSANLTGKKFLVDVADAGFEVAGEFSTWRVQWPGVQLTGENEKVLLICSGERFSCSGKKYLTGQQQDELRRLAGLV